MTYQSVTALKNFGVGLSFGALPKTFAERFTEMLDEKGLSGRAVAAASGIVESQISDYKRGAVIEPSIFTALKIVRALGCTIEEFVEGLDVDYDDMRSDLIDHAGDLSSGRPQAVGGTLDVDHSARVLTVLQDLVAAIERQETTTSEMRELANRLVDITAASAEADSVADEKPASGSDPGKPD